MLKKAVEVCVFCCLLTGAAVAAEVQLGTPPNAPKDLTRLLLSPQEKAESGLAKTLQSLPSIDPQNRNASRSFYNTHYSASGSQDIAWTGNRSTCTEGTTAADFKDAVDLRINYFRAMAGVPASIFFSATYSAKDQKTALMMSVNGQLSHTPDASWTCYSIEGAEGASNSNIALGACGWDSISLYMKDPGQYNSAVGHRRWILYPQTQQMGIGDIPSDGGWAANALWVFDGNYGSPRPDTREEYVAWPPRGYTPFQVVYPRWSFSYPGADFSNATVTMTENQQPISTALETVQTGYGENTLVWIPKGMSHSDVWPQPAADTRYGVVINNVLIAGNARSFTYEVIVFDPATEPPAVPKQNPSLLLLLGD